MRKWGVSVMDYGAWDCGYGVAWNNGWIAVGCKLGVFNRKMLNTRWD